MLFSAHPNIHYRTNKKELRANDVYSREDADCRK